MYVNSRIVKCPVFQKAIDMVYKNLTGNSRYPFIVLNLEIPPVDVDVNVHPSKREVKYKNPNQIFNFIYSSIDSALKSIIEKEKEKTQIIYNERITKQNKDIFINEDTFVDEESSIAQIFTKNYKEESSEKVIPIKPNNTVNNKIEPKFQNHQNNFVQSKLITPQEFTWEDVIIGQYKKTYILIEKENGLEIVDQHIADERYIYEQLKKSKNIDCQLLFISDVIPVSATDKELLKSNKAKLEKFGYELDFISDTEVIFRKVPQILSRISPKEILADILENIAGNIDNIEEKILITTSCKAAVKANTYLNQYQMEEIIRNWRTCENPETCPHGRPISKFFEHKDLAKFFMRSK